MQPQASPASSGVVLTRKGQKYADRHSRHPPQRTLRQLAKLRQEAEAEIERLITFLDETEPDPDLEPSLGDYNARMRDFGDDREGDYADNEPSLGWIGDYAVFAGNDDREGDPGEYGIGDLDALGLLSGECANWHKTQETPFLGAWAALREGRPSRSIVIIGPDGNAYSVDQTGLTGREARS